MSENSTKIDLIDALAIEGGDPKKVTLDGKDLNIRRNYTGAEVQQILNAHTPEEAQGRLDDQLDKVLAFYDADDDLEAREEFRDKILEQTISAISRMMVRIGQVAGLRGRDGDFLTGAQF